MTPGPASRTPLARLFAVAYRSLVTDLHLELRARGWTDVRPAYGFVLLALQSAPMTSAALGERLGMTKQAASKLVEGMSDAGYLTRTTDAEDGRQRPLVLTDRGRVRLATVETISVDLAARGAVVVGPEEVERMRQGLTAALTDHGRRPLPAVRPAW